MSSFWFFFAWILFCWKKVSSQLTELFFLVLVAIFNACMRGERLLFPSWNAMKDKVVMLSYCKHRDKKHRRLVIQTGDEQKEVLMGTEFSFACLYSYLCVMCVIYVKRALTN